MSESTLYFQDFLINSNAQQCDWCGEIKLLSDVRLVQLDVEGDWQWLCGECVEAYDQHHSL